jgi:hypothetical protein
MLDMGLSVANDSYRSDMKSRDIRKKAPERIKVQRVSIVGRAASWLILQSLGIALLVVVAGIGFSTWKYLSQEQFAAKLPDPFSPAAVYASPVAPIDYRQHPPQAGMTAEPPLPYFPPPTYTAPLPVSSSGSVHRVVSHTQHRPGIRSPGG